MRIQRESIRRRAAERDPRSIVEPVYRREARELSFSDRVGGLSYSRVEMSHPTIYRCASLSLGYFARFARDHSFLFYY